MYSLYSDVLDQYASHVRQNIFELRLHVKNWNVYRNQEIRVGEHWREIDSPVFLGAQIRVARNASNETYELQRRHDPVRIEK